MKYKAIVKEKPLGVQLTLYREVFFGWMQEERLYPLTVTRIIEEYLERWQKLYTDLIIIDERNA